MMTAGWDTSSIDTPPYFAIRRNQVGPVIFAFLRLEMTESGSSVFMPGFRLAPNAGRNPGGFLHSDHAEFLFPSRAEEALQERRVSRRSRETSKSKQSFRIRKSALSLFFVDLINYSTAFQYLSVPG